MNAVVWYFEEPGSECSLMGDVISFIVALKPGRGGW